MTDAAIDEIDVGMPTKLPLAPGGNWRPIASAPHAHDVDILVWHAMLAVDEETGNRIDKIVDGRVYVSYWDGAGWAEPDAVCSKPGAHWLGDDWEYANGPSFWMPLPKGPDVVVEARD